MAPKQYFKMKHIQCFYHTICSGVVGVMVCGVDGVHQLYFHPRGRRDVHRRTVPTGDVLKNFIITIKVKTCCHDNGKFLLTFV